MADLKLLGVNYPTIPRQRQVDPVSDRLLFNTIGPSGGADGPLVISPVAAVSGASAVLQVSNGSAVVLSVTGGGQVNFLPVSSGVHPSQWASVHSYGDTSLDLQTVSTFLSETSPEGVISAPPGSVCHVRYPSANANDGVWTKNSGTGTAGWVRVQAGVSAHSALTGLSNDDHPQYLLIDGTRAMTGQFKSIAGTELLPGVTFSGETSTGAFLIGAGVYGIATLGGERVRFGEVDSTLSTNWFPESDLTFDLGFYETEGDPPLRWRNGYIDNVEGSTADFDASVTSAVGSFQEVFTGSGSVAAPSLVFWDSGFYAPISGALSWESGGADVLVLSSGGGTLSGNWNPSADLTYNLGSGGLRWNEIFAGTITASTITAPHSSLTGLGADDHTQYLLVDGTRAMSGGLRLADGLVGTPSLAFTTDTTSGMYRPASGVVGISAGGSEKARFDAQGLGIALDGADATPAIFRTADPDTGIYFSTNSLRMVAGGSTGAMGRILLNNNQLQLMIIGGVKLDVSNTEAIFSVATRPGTTNTYDLGTSAVRWRDIFLAGAVSTGNGLVGAPAWTFASDPDSGVYHHAATADTFYVVAGGSQMMSFQPGGTGFHFGGALQWFTVSNVFNAMNSGSMHAQGVGGTFTIGARQDGVASVLPSLTINQYANLPFVGANVAQLGTRIDYILNQTGTSGFTALDFKITETAVGSGTQSFISAKGGAAGATERFAVRNDGAVQLPNGTLTRAALGFLGNPDTGIINADALGSPGVPSMLFMVDGVFAGGFIDEASSGDVQFRTTSGSLAVPSLAIDQNDMGFYAPSGTVIAAVAEGAEVFRFESPSLDPTLTVASATRHNAAGIFPLFADMWVGDSATSPFASALPWGGVIAYQHAGADAGTASLPTYGWDVTGFLTTGIYLDGGVAISNEGTQVANFDGVKSTGASVVDGIKFTPAISTTGTGGFNGVAIDVNEPVASGSGAKSILDLRYATASKLQVRTSGQIIAVDGSETVPTYADSVGTSGIYFDGNRVHFVSDGTCIASIDKANMCFAPHVDATYSLGAGFARWSDVHAVTTTIGDLVMKDPHGGRAHLKLVEGEATLHVYDIRNGKKYHVPLVEDEMSEADLAFIEAERVRWPEYT